MEHFLHGKHCNIKNSNMNRNDTKNHVFKALT